MSRPRNIERLVEDQARSFEARQRMGDAPARRTVQGPYITISRQFGSGGSAFARRLAGQLGWELLDRDLVRTLASESKIDPQAFAQHDEHAMRPFDDYLAHLFLPADPGQAGYLQVMTRIVGEHARRGRTIVLGRGANWFLDPRSGLRLRLVAPFERRAARVAERESLDTAAAEARVREHDAERRRFIQQVFQRDIDDPLGYDAVINLDTVGETVAAGMVLAALAGKTGERGQEPAAPPR